MSIKQWDKSLRPREKAIQMGIETLSDSELLAIILRCGSKEVDAVGLANSILQSVGGLSNLLDMSLNELVKIKGIGKATACQIISCLEIVKRKNYQKMINSDVLKTPSSIINWLKSYIGNQDQEYFVVIYLNNRNQAIGHHTLYKGSNNQVPFSSREIFINALNNKASKIVIAHNHPSQHVEPSLADDAATNEIVKAGKIMGIPVVDHIVVSYSDYYSYKENEII